MELIERHTWVNIKAAVTVAIRIFIHYQVSYEMPDDWILKSNEYQNQNTTRRERECVFQLLTLGHDKSLALILFTLWLPPSLRTTLKTSFFRIFWDTVLDLHQQLKNSLLLNLQDVLKGGCCNRTFSPVRTFSWHTLYTTQSLYLLHSAHFALTVKRSIHN